MLAALTRVGAWLNRVLWIVEADPYEAGYEAGRAALLAELAREQEEAEARLEALGFARLDAGDLSHVKGGAPHVP